MCVRAGLDSPRSRGAFLGISPQLLSASGMIKKKQFKCSLKKITTAKFCFKGWKAPHPHHTDFSDLQRALGAAAHHIKGVSVGLGAQTWNIQVPQGVHEALSPCPGNRYSLRQPLPSTQLCIKGDLKNFL